VTKDILARFGLTEKQLESILIYREVGIAKPIPLYLKGGTEYTFGAIGDTHLCSKEERIRELLTFYRICQKKGVKDIYHAGDILAGQNVYSGQEFELHTFGADSQVAYAVRNYPNIEGIRTHFILGNHCYSFFKNAGMDVGFAIAKERPDMTYLGAFYGEVMMEKIRLIHLVHPSGGMPYSISYRAQRIVTEISSGDKPRILLVGHLHTSYSFLYRNIFVFGVGCFEGQTPFLARKGINPVIGGWIIKITFGQGRAKSTTSVVSEFIPFWG